MFELENYEIYIEDNVHKIKYWIRNNTNKEVDAVLNFIQLPFRTYTRLFSIKLGPNGSYWVSLTLRELMSDPNAGLYWGMYCGVDLEIKVDGECQYKISLPWTLTNDYLRKGINFNSTIHKPKFWMIGDSHVNYNTTAPVRYLTTQKYDIVSVSVQALSLSRFLNSDWKRFFTTIPIWEMDVISFEMGDVDLRMSLLKKSEEKNTPVGELLKDLIVRFSNFIDEFKNIYKNEIIILLPNRTVKDGWDKDNRVMSTTKIRVDLWNQFRDLMLELGKINNIKIWDYKSIYEDSDGSMLNSMLVKEDVHLESHELMLEDLKSKINTYL
jgi:hypothetical protein